MGYRVIPLLLAAGAACVGLGLGGCGKEIGDSCTYSTDCDSNGERLCVDPTVHGGYCTIGGCGYDTCPEEAVCARFFTAQYGNTTCDRTAAAGTAANPCTTDELCSVAGHCVPLSAEVRYCMKKCDSNDDCRDGYECRTLDLMVSHGGEPVPKPGEAVSSSPTKFCAVAPGSS